MAYSLVLTRSSFIFFIYAVLASQACYGRLPLHLFSTGDHIYAKVATLASIETNLPFSYYSLPFCKPAKLPKQQIYSSPYRFRMNINDSVFLCTTARLTEKEEKLLKDRISDVYQVNMILDGLPVIMPKNLGGPPIQWTGYPVGYSPTNDKHYINNHLKFRVLVHEHEGAEGLSSGGYEIVGFEVVPCSLKHEADAFSGLPVYGNVSSVACPFGPEKAQIVREGETVSFTYEVEFVKSSVRWSSRLDSYRRTVRWDSYRKTGACLEQWLSVFGLPVVEIVILAMGFVFVIIVAKICLCT